MSGSVGSAAELNWTGILNPARLQTLLDRVEIVPAVNQIEVHPYYTKRATREFNAAHCILTQA